MPTSLGSNIATATPSAQAGSPGGSDTLVPSPIDFVDGLFVAGHRPQASGPAIPVSEYHILANDGAFTHAQAVRADDPRIAGGLALIAADYALGANDGCVIAQLSAAATLTLLPEAGAVRDITIKNRAGSTANLAVVAPDSATVEGAPVSVAPGQFLRLLYDEQGAWVRIG